jgi:hypothetical protein
LISWRECEYRREGKQLMTPCTAPFNITSRRQEGAVKGGGDKRLVQRPGMPNLYRMGWRGPEVVPSAGLWSVMNIRPPGLSDWDHCGM